MARTKQRRSCRRSASEGSFTDVSVTCHLTQVNARQAGTGFPYLEEWKAELT